MLEYGEFNAKDAARRSYVSKRPSEAARRWAVAYAAEAYERLTLMTTSNADVDVHGQQTRLKQAAIRSRQAATNESAGVGWYAHTAVDEHAAA